MSEERINTDAPLSDAVAETGTRDLGRERLCRLLGDASVLAEEQGLDLVRYLIHMALLEATGNRDSAAPPRTGG